jgi:hypothetical protein
MQQLMELQLVSRLENPLSLQVPQLSLQVPMALREPRASLELKGLMGLLVLLAPMGLLVPVHLVQLLQLKN